MSTMLTLQQALPWLSGARLIGDGSVAVQRVHSDTRTLQPGDLFVALKGERFDANDFLPEARAKGAVAALCSNEAALRAAGLTTVALALPPPDRPNSQPSNRPARRIAIKTTA
jgi:UDP-N-acetylmuramoyl-tripeptide--D-alanyl-D-alanine ligase